MKVNVTFNDDLMKRIDEYAERNYMSRSGLISFATTQFLNGQQLVSAVQDMSVCMRKIAETGIVDEETERRLQELEIVAKVLVGK